MRVTMIDNYDSFTFNLVQDLYALGHRVQVYRNDSVEIAQILGEKPDAIVVSPGPSTPDNAGICLDLIQQCESQIAVFGVCLGMQCIVQAMGGKILLADQVYHGKTSKIKHFDSVLFTDIPSPFVATRYHSLVSDPTNTDLTVTAVNLKNSDNVSDVECIMAVENSSRKLYGVQFHPESYMTQYGKKILENFLKTV